MGQSSGGSVKGPKGPFAFNQLVFSNFFKSLKIRTAWRKDFFDTLRDFPQPGKSLLVLGILFFCAAAAGEAFSLISGRGTG